MSRKVAREVAFKIVFELAFQNDEEAAKLYEKMIEASEEKFEITEEDNLYINEMIDGIQSNESSIDEQIKSHLKDWSFDRLSKIDLAILRLAIYEINYREDIPCKVSVNEAVELAKIFGEDSSPAFINGILAEVLKEVEE
ncbi:MAG: transcription antitermination factor NusB [Clostridia bacterium]|nr:transcription antitermination factor NusB [Clostridia bacterium]